MQPRPEGLAQAFLIGSDQIAAVSHRFARSEYGRYLAGLLEQYSP